MIRLIDSGGRVEPTAVVVLGAGIALDEDGDGRPRINPTGGGSDHGIMGHNDTVEQTLADRQVIAYDSVAGEWRNRLLQAADLPTHTHDLADLNQSGAVTDEVAKWSGSAWVAGSVDWTELTGKPSTFPPDNHVIESSGPHTAGAVLTVGHVLRATSSSAFSFGAIEAGDLPAHTHDASEIDSGTLSDARLSSNVALQNATNVFTVDQEIQDTLTLSGNVPLDLTDSGGSHGIRMDTSFVKRITWNDGGGNWNFRSGHDWTDAARYILTGDAAVHLEINTDSLSNAVVKIKTAPSGSAGGAVTWGHTWEILHGSGVRWGGSEGSGQYIGSSDSVSLVGHTHDAGDITSGSFAKARLPAAVAYEDEANVFTVADNIFEQAVMIGLAGASQARLRVEPDHTNDRVRLIRQISGVSGDALDLGSDLKWGGDLVWTAGNDGPGSGLNADTVDGVQGANLARTDVAETFAQALNVQGLLTAQGDVDVEGTLDCNAASTSRLIVPVGADKWA